MKPSIPPCVMSNSVVVVGTGPNWKEEFLSVAGEDSAMDIMAVNKAIRDINVPITHAVSMHTALIQDWVKDRPEKDKIIHHTIQGGANVGMFEYNFDYPWMDLSSGMFAIKIAMESGYDKIYLAGLPLNHENNLVPIRTCITDIKDEFKNVVVPDHYWWKEFITINGDTND